MSDSISERLQPIHDRWIESGCIDHEANWPTDGGKFDEYLKSRYNSKLYARIQAIIDAERAKTNNLLLHPNI